MTAVKALRAIAAACALLLPGLASAQDWPTRPVTIVVPFAPGGTTDIVGRLIGQAMSVKLGQPVIIDNVGGAGGTLGATKASKASPDGYTIFMATVAHTMAPAIYEKLAYNFETDFEPVIRVASVPNILVVNNDVPAKSVAELIAYIKANPGKVNYGSAGVGSTEHMSGELFRAISGTSIVHVPYRGGSPMLADLMAGHIQMALEPSGASAPFVKSGKIRALAVSSGKRSALFPDLPTLNEAGLKGYDVTTWYGFLVPKGTPEPVRQKLYTVVAGILKEPDMIKRLADVGAEPSGDGPAQFATFIKVETDKWTELAKKTNIKAQ